MPKKPNPSAAESKPPSTDSPEEIRRKFRPVAIRTSAPDPEPMTLPTVDLNTTVSAMAGAVGQILHGAPLFRHALGLVTVDEITGEMEQMNPERFCSWVEDHLAFVKWGKEGSHAESIGVDLARKLLKADRLAAHLRELRAIHPVRLPVFRGEEGTEGYTVDLSAPGYDPANGILTLDGVPYADNLSKEEGFSFLWEALRYFKWEEEGQKEMGKRRSFAGMLAAMLGVFCHGLLKPGSSRPMIVICGNQPGTGKSLLVRMALCPVYGMVPEGGRPENEAELEKVLDSAAMARKPYLVLDDVVTLRSQALNRFATSPVHECRRMHSQTLCTAPKMTQVFLTGNSLTVTEDLERRAIIIDLFEPGKAAARLFPKGMEITSSKLAKSETRARFLGSLWALVRNWKEEGLMPGLGRKPSFEEFAEVVGGILASASKLLADPFGERKTVAGGDESTKALVFVMGVVVGGYDIDGKAEPCTQDIQDAAEKEGLLETIVGYGKDKDPRRALGHRLKKLRGREFQDATGRRYQFGKRDSMSGAVYPITFLESPPAADG